MIFMRIRIKSDVGILNDAGKLLLFRTRPNLVWLPVKNHIAVLKNNIIAISLIGSRTLIICPIDVLEGGIGLFKIFTERIHR